MQLQQRQTKVEQNQNRDFHRNAFNAIFLLTRHSSVFQIIPWNWEHLINRKVQGKKAFWHVILHYFSCYYIATLCVSFLSKSEAIDVFPKHILKSKARDQSIQATKKLFCHVIVNNLCNVSWKILIKIESTWRRNVKEQAPELTSLHRGKTARSSHRRCCIRKLFLKILQYPQETPVLESIFKKVADL